MMSSFISDVKILFTPALGVTIESGGSNSDKQTVGG
jgi:hypothetical protein